MRKTFTLALALAALTASVPASADVRRFGVMVDAGVPDGANGSMVFRPWSFLRLHAGGGTNFIAPGVRAGLGVDLPILGLSANVEAGHAWSGDAQPLARKISGMPELSVASLDEVGYRYANFRLGLDIGKKYVTFFIHGGMSVIQGNVHHAGETLSSDGTRVTFASDPRVTVWSPSVRLGLIVYIMH